MLKIYPSECRQRGLTYRAPLKVVIQIFVNGIRIESCECLAGEVSFSISVVCLLNYEYFLCINYFYKFLEVVYIVTRRLHDFRNVVFIK